jgi:biopolymer transport protein ExbB/TolQ
MNVPVGFFAETNLGFVLKRATVEAQVILVVLALFSVFAWAIMFFKAMQMKRAIQLNQNFDSVFRSEKSVLGIYERHLEVSGCPYFAVYKEGCQELDARLKAAGGDPAGKRLTLKAMEHIKRTLESAVARESIKLESGLILLASAVSGGPFLGLLGTVWGVMDTFAMVGQAQQADLPTMAPGVSAALITTVAGLVVAIPSMFGYNFLVHNLRVQTVELDNFAQELVSKMETEYLIEE